MEKEILQAILAIGEEAYAGCEKRGFKDTVADDAKTLLLMHAEISEATEYLRQNNPPSDHIPEFSGMEEELADLIIRICNYAYAKKYRLGEAILAKMAFNETRPYRHNGKNF